MSIEVQFVKTHEDAIPPRQAYDGDVGWDLFTLADTTLSWSPENPMFTWVRTGLAVAIPHGFFGRIVGRSSAASRGLHVIEGTIDAGYRGELLARVVPLWRPEQGRGVQMSISAGVSLAQLIVQPVMPVTFAEVSGLPESERGDNGFGSSG